jgi:hypothetical protein
MKSIKSIVLAAACGILVFSTNAIAQTAPAIKKDSNWTKGGLASFNFSQVALSNWAGGGQSSIAINGFLNLFANYKKGIHSWENSLDLGYGIVQQGTADFIKSDDKIDFTSKYGRQASEKWYYTGLVNFKSQFAPGYNTPAEITRISDFLAPAYVLASIGMDYKPSKVFSAYISPITAKFTIVNDDSLNSVGAFGVEENEILRSEFGGFVRLQYRQDILENVNLQSRLELFSNYSNNPQNIDVNWETILALKVNKFITANVSATVVYDDDIDIEIDNDDDGVVDKTGPRTQFKQVLSVGLAYKF